jgi:dihydrofolate reductase
MNNTRSQLHPNLSLIVAASENGVIGLDGDLPWHLSEDLKQFKKLTLGHHIVLGRKTFDSIGRLLPGRTTVILTTNRSYQCEGAVVCHSLDELAKVIADDDEPFIVGGAELYRQTLSFARTLFLTRVHTTLVGDATFEFEPTEWSLVASERFSKGPKNDFDFTMEKYVRSI